MQSQIGDLDAGPAQRRHRLVEGGVAGDRHRDRARTGTRGGVRGGRRARRGDRVEDPQHVRHPGRIGWPYPQGEPADAAFETVRGVVGDHPAVVDHHDLVGERVSLLEVLGGEQNAGALGDAPHVLALGRVETGGRLVEEDHLRMSDQARGEVQAAAHPSRVRLGRPARRVGEVEPVEQLGGALSGVPGGEVEQPADQHQVLRTGQILVDRGVLAGESDPAAYALWLSQHVDAGDERATGVRAQQRGEHPYGGGLAGAVGPEHAEHRAAAHRQVHPVECLGLPEPLAESFRLYYEIAHGGVRPFVAGRASTCRLARAAGTVRT
ncbi:MAG: hypothetical protein QOE51_2969 [Actinoplanes sp.]|nr:hypothetical protein [Actinoplanes sp.]